MQKYSTEYSLVSNKDIATVPISTPPNQAEAPMCNIDVSVIFTWGVYFSSDIHITGYYDLLILLMPVTASMA